LLCALLFLSGSRDVSSHALDLPLGFRNAFLFVPLSKP
jgi:hypothetical protein